MPLLDYSESLLEISRHFRELTQRHMDQMLGGAPHLTQADVDTIVARGANLLDQRIPGWAERIDVRQLDIASSFWCPLGQLFGDFSTGLVTLGIEGQSQHYGFCSAWCSNYHEIWDLLKHAWIVAVATRLVANQAKVAEVEKELCYV